MLFRSGVTEDELAMSKEQLKSSFVFSQENVASRMFANGKNVVLLDKACTDEEILTGISNVSLADIDEVKQMICKPELYSGVAVTNKDFDFSKLW